jgi:hypothetical protein
LKSSNVILIVIGLGLVAVVLLFFRAQRNKSDEVAEKVRRFESEFPTGTSTDFLLQRALDQGAESLTWKVAGKSDLSAEIATDAKDFPESELQAIRTSFAQNPAGFLVVVFPVYMLDRWVVRIHTDQHRIASIESQHLE